MSAVEVVSDSRGHVGDDPDTHEFRPLSEEEKQHFVNFDAAKSTPPFVGEADQATNSTEENEVLAGRELVVLPPNGQPLAPLMESFPIQNLEFPPNQVATSRYGQDRGVMLQFIFPLLVSVVAFLLVLRFYPALHSSLPAISDQTDQQLAASSPLPILTTTSDSSPETTAPAAFNASMPSEIEAPQGVPTKPKSIVQAPRQKSAARMTKAQAKKERRRAVQLTGSGWLGEPSWSRDADSFIKYLYFGRIN